MDDEDYKVSSELYKEQNYETNLAPTQNQKNVVSIFKFQIGNKSIEIDVDGDLEVERRTCKDTIQTIEIEHQKSTILNLVGLQVWRGALLLADWLIYNHKNLPNKTILEIGSGVGLTSIVASMFRPVVCTDMNEGGILELIQHNFDRNKQLIKSSTKVSELNFFEEFSDEIQKELQNIELILAADVIYDDNITKAFVKVIEKLLKESSRCVYVALEKRYVFTINDCDVVAPCYEYFIELIEGCDFSLEQVDLNFPQYFQYDRVKELVMWKISKAC